MRLLIPIAVLVLIGLFITGAIAPRRSRRVEHWIDDRLERGESRTRRRGGRFGDWVARTLDISRRAADKALQIGRRAR